MSRALDEIITNPTRMRIMQAFYCKDSLTAGEIYEQMNDIPRTTFYRHINALIDANALVIVDEKKVRGSYERILAMNKDELKKQNLESVKDGFDVPMFFLMDKYLLFQKYFNGANPDPIRDKFFLFNATLMMDDIELDQFLLELKMLFSKYGGQYMKEKKPRNISIIHAPMGNEAE